MTKKNTHSWQKPYTENGLRESAKAYTLFKKYDQMPLDHTLKDLQKENPTIKLDYIYECSKKYKWKQRKQDRITYESQQIQEIQQAETIKYYQDQIEKTQKNNQEIDEIITKLNQVILLKINTILPNPTQEQKIPDNPELNRNKLTSLLMAHEKLLNSKHINTKILLRTLGQPETLREKDTEENTNNEDQIKERQTQTADNIIKLIQQGSGKIERHDTQKKGDMEDES